MDPATSISAGEKVAAGTMIVPPTTRETPALLTNQLVYCRQVVMKTLFRHHGSTVFKKPVNPVEVKLPDYYKFCPEPMDLGTIRDRLTNRYYSCVEECMDDFQLMFVNCYTYNPPRSEVVKNARELELTLIRKLVDMPEPEEQVPSCYKIVSRRSSEGSQGSTVAAAEEEQMEEEQETKREPRLRKARMLDFPETKEDDHAKQSNGFIGKGMNKKKQREDLEPQAGNESQAKSESSSEDELEEGEIETDIFKINKERRASRIMLLEKQIAQLNVELSQLHHEAAEDKWLQSLQKSRGRSVASKGRVQKRKRRSVSAASSKSKGTARKIARKSRSATPRKRSTSTAKATSSKKLAATKATQSVSPPVVELQQENPAKERSTLRAVSPDIVSICSGGVIGAPVSAAYFTESPNLASATASTPTTSAATQEPKRKEDDDDDDDEEDDPTLDLY